MIIISELSWGAAHLQRCCSDSTVSDPRNTIQHTQLFIKWERRCVVAAWTLGRCCWSAAKGVSTLRQRKENVASTRGELEGQRNSKVGSVWEAYTIMGGTAADIAREQTFGAWWLTSNGLASASEWIFTAISPTFAYQTHSRYECLRSTRVWNSRNLWAQFKTHGIQD